MTLAKRPSFWTAIGLALFLIVAIAHAEQSFDISICGSGTVTILSETKELSIFALEGKGIVLSNHENKIFDKWTWQAINVGKIAKNERATITYYKLMDPDGDLVFLEAVGDAKETALHFLHGTGKWIGIAGNGKTSLIAMGKPVTPDTRQACRRLTGTFEIRK